MTRRSKGRALLEILLGHAERVVRVEPAGVLVLMGVPSELSEAVMEPLTTLLPELGVECSGVIVLTDNMTMESIDMDEVVRMYSEAGAVPQGTDLVQTKSVHAVVIEVPCPRCPVVIPIRASASIVDNGSGMHAQTITDDSDLRLHELLCAGKVAEDR